MQATILCEGEELGIREIGLDSEADWLPELPPPPTLELSTLSLADATAALREPPPPSWEELQQGVRRQIEAALDAGLSPALGTYLIDDFVLEGFDAARQVSSRAAMFLGIPKTTFRRKLSKARRRASDGASDRPPGWREIRDSVSALVRCEPDGEDRLERARRLLLEEVVVFFPQDAKSGAAFMGVSLPTYRRWMNDRETVLA